MAELPPCCRRAAQKYMDIGLSPAASAAKAMAQHPGHRESQEFSSGKDDKDKGEEY